jgi:hypothetical protein
MPVQHGFHKKRRRIAGVFCGRPANIPVIIGPVSG